MKTDDYLQMILSLVADECGESVEDIRSACRRMELVQCRTMYCAVAWQLLHPALRCIAKPVNRCEASVHDMILNHLKIKDRMYVAQHERVKGLAAHSIFRNFP